MNRLKPRARGFTLLEVLVALAVLALALGAVIKLASQASANLVELRDRTVADWVAANKVNELLLARAPPPLGFSDGVSELGGRVWHWRVQVSATDDADLRRLAVTVYGTDGARALAELAAFRGVAQ